MNFKSDSTRRASLAFAAFALLPMSFAGPAAASSSLRCTHHTITTCTVDAAGKRTCTVTGGYDVCVVVDSPSGKAAVSGALQGKAQIFQSKSLLSKR